MESFVSSFQYQPLDATSETIRVVILQSGHFDTPIRCKLQHVDLNEKPWYEALSYVWGDPTATMPIQLENDSTFPVTKNLERALRYLRREDASRVLWIDAICIDQQNVPEKNRQVQKMARIYESASRVQLWVGEEDDPGPFGIMSPIPIDYILIFLAKVAAMAETWGEGEPLPKEVDRYKKKDWMAALACFEGRPWFQRLWIIQEAVLNPNTELMCGHHAILWSDFRVGFLMAAQGLVLPDTDSKKTNNQFTWMSRLVECHMWADAWINKHAEVHVLDRIGLLLFLLNGDFNSTDPRDRLYSILGVVGDAALISPWSGLKVSYEKSVVEVFRDLAITVIEDREKLTILAGYDLKWRKSKDLVNKPSWVPTWGSEQHCNLREMALNRVGDTTGLRAIVRFSADKNTLFAHGVEIGRVASIGPTFVGGRDNVEAFSAQIQDWDAEMLGTASVLQKYGSQFGIIASWELAFTHAADGAYMRSDSVCYHFLAGRLSMNVLEAEPERSALAMLGYIERATKKFENKRPLILDSGHVGMAEGVDTVELDDLICLFRGAPFPFILRKEGDHYIFVGNCFIHDFMDIPGEEAFVGSKEFEVR